MSIFKNVFKQAPHLISNLFAGAVTVLTAIVAFGTDATEAFTNANCSECVTISSKAVAIATIGLGVAKVFGVKVDPVPALEDAPLEIPEPIQPAPEPAPIEVVVEPAPEPVPVEPTPEPVPVEPATKPKKRTRKSK